MKRGQIWVETVIYLLIALTMIGAVLAFARPKIQEIQDKAVIEQTIEILEEIDRQITQVNQGGVGNKRIIEIEIKKGELQLKGSNDEIVFSILGTNSLYSEEGVSVKKGKITAYTEKEGEVYNVRLSLEYDGTYNIKVEGDDRAKVIPKATTPYTISITNIGGVDKEINFEVVD